MSEIPCDRCGETVPPPDRTVNVDGLWHFHTSCPPYSVKNLRELIRHQERVIGELNRQLSAVEPTPEPCVVVSVPDNKGAPWLVEEGRPYVAHYFATEAEALAMRDALNGVGSGVAARIEGLTDDDCQAIMDSLVSHGWRNMRETLRARLLPEEPQ